MVFRPLIDATMSHYSIFTRVYSLFTYLFTPKTAFYNRRTPFSITKITRILLAQEDQLLELHNV